jgi:nicotinamide mononucleotide transporter
MAETEWVAFLLSLVYVVLNARQNIWCWPVGAASVLVYAFVFFNAKLYADAGLQVIYLGFSLYGWLSWRQIKLEDTQPVKTLTKRISGISLVLSIMLFAIIYIPLSHYSDSTTPVMDALTAAFSLTATYLSAKKFIENWPLWIVTNTAYILLYIYKDLQLTALLSLLMAILAALGWYSWHKQLKLQVP